ncbi:hypothetical protein G6L37_00395 [Agrobacterium rubi]|nr:hypothetical protein [Agrobacterium rubi]NTF23848.1 hypothetical protein [Agrobacterium rubi]
MSVGETVSEWVSSLCTYGGGEYDDQIRTYRDKTIVAEYDGRVVPFPQRDFRYRNVMTWALLDDGSAVGFNESPRTGFSFPRAGKKIVDRYLEHYADKLEEASNRDYFNPTP